MNSLLAMFVLAGAGWSYLTLAGHSTAAASSNPSTRQVSVSTGTVTATVSASGSVQSANTAAADFVSAGTVTEIDAKVGDLVTKGQVLAKVDPTAAQETLNTAQANLQAAKDALSVAQADSTSAAATISAATAQVSSAQATVDADQRAVDGTVLTAPMAGTVTAVNGSVGNSSSSGSSATAGTGTSGGSGNGGTGTGNTAGGNASSGNGSSSSSSSSASSSGFIQLSDLTQLQVSASFAESDATKLKVGQTVDVTWSALSGTQATGKVASISPTATASGGVNSYPVVVSLDSVPDGARLGQTTTVVVTVAQADSVVRVPVAAVTSAGGRHTVRAVSGGTTSTVAIQVGVQGDTYDEVTSGLSAGQVLEYTVKTSTGTGTTGGGGGFGGGGFGGAGGLGGAGAAAGAGGGLGGNRGGGG